MKTSAYARSGAVFHPSIGTLTSWLADIVRDIASA